MHAVQFYDTEAELLPTIVRHIGMALRLGNDAVVVARPSLAQALALDLHRENLQRAFGRSRGKLVTLDADKTLGKFMVDGWPDPVLFDESVGALMATATAGNRVAVAYGEMVVLLCERNQYAAALRLEQLWNGLLGKLRFSLLCAYPNRLFASMEGKANLRHVCAAHSQLVGRTPGSVHQA